MTQTDYWQLSHGFLLVENVVSSIGVKYHIVSLDSAFPIVVLEQNGKQTQGTLSGWMARLRRMCMKGFSPFNCSKASAMELCDKRRQSLFV